MRRSGKPKFKYPRKEKRLVLAAIQTACSRLGLPGLAFHITFTKLQLTRDRVAQADFFGPKQCPRMCIEANPTFWEDCSDADKRTIIAHEVAHLVNHLKHGLKVPAHGKKFMKLLKQTGYFEREKKIGGPAKYARLFK